MQAIRLVLPATSANLGPGFDALGLALALNLTVDAEISHATDGPPLTIEATGRNAERCARVSDNLIFETCADVLRRHDRAVPRLHLRVHNEIPLGMGLGSSAAALLAGVTLANHFGELYWDARHCMEEACRREGHPDNVAACALGYMTVSADSDSGVVAATCGEDVPWKFLIALPSASLATETARALLPPVYSRHDVVSNLQRTGLLVSAFGMGRGDLLRVAMQDRLHQPYRMEACPLLPRLLPLAGSDGVLGVALSGAGPAMLLICDSTADISAIDARIHEAAADPALEVVETTIAGPARHSYPGAS